MNNRRMNVEEELKPIPGVAQTTIAIADAVIKLSEAANIVWNAECTHAEIAVNANAVMCTIDETTDPAADVGRKFADGDHTIWPVARAKASWWHQDSGAGAITVTQLRL